MRRARLIWFALAGALCAAPASGQQAIDDDDQRTCYRQDTARECAARHFWDDEDVNVSYYRSLFERASWKPSTGCQKVKAALLQAFDQTEGTVDGETMVMIFALPNDSAQDWTGSYWDSLNVGTENLIVVNDTMSDEKQWWTFQHEAAHHAGYDDDTSKSFNAYTAEGCATKPKDDPDGGGSNENDPDDDDENCSTKTVWIPVQTPCVYEPTGPVPCNPSCGEVVACWIQVLIPKEVKTCY